MVCGCEVEAGTGTLGVACAEVAPARCNPHSRPASRRGPARHRGRGGAHGARLVCERTRCAEAATTRKDSLSCTDDESLSPPGSPAIAHSGTSEAFIPCGATNIINNSSSSCGSSTTVSSRISSEKVAPSSAAINLSELPVPGLLKIMCPYLQSKEDRYSI